MTERYEYQIQPASPESFERTDDAPILDVMRHGETTYKELSDPSFIFDPSTPGFALDERHLDLTNEGIETVRETGRQLAQTIDASKEIVVVISSPNFRAQSTALVLEDELRKAGILLPMSGSARLRTTRSLRQVAFRDEADLASWIKADRAFRSEDERHHRLLPEEAWKKIALLLGKDVEDIFAENASQMNTRLNRFIRHASNVQRFLKGEVKEALLGKRLRIIAVTHEELPSLFMQQALGTKKNLKRGQILELRPQTPLVTNEANLIEVELYSKGEGSEEGKATIQLDIRETS